MVLTQSQEVNPMKIPHPGELRQLVEIGRTVHEINENGFSVETEQVICQVWAKAEDCDSRYFTSGGAENTERGIWFTIRWRNDVRPGMWVLWNGQKQTVKSEKSSGEIHSVSFFLPPGTAKEPKTPSPYYYYSF